MHEYTHAHTHRQSLSLSHLLLLNPIPLFLTLSLSLNHPILPPISPTNHRDKICKLSACMTVSENVSVAMVVGVHTPRLQPQAKEGHRWPRTPTSPALSWHRYVVCMLTFPNSMAAVRGKCQNCFVFHAIRF